MPFNIDAADHYARSRMKTIADLTDEEIEMFSTEHGVFVHDNFETRCWSAIHPKNGDRFHSYKNQWVYIVRSIDPLYEFRDGHKERKSYAMFFDPTEADEYIEAMGWDRDKFDVIPCKKKDFRKSIWGWDVDGF